MKFEVIQNGVLVSTTPSTTINLTGLTPSTKYTVSVTPSNGLEKGTAATLAFTTASAGQTVTIPAAANTVTVESYVDAIGTETNGLGTSTYGLGGSDPVTVTPTKVTKGSTSTTVVLPIDYTPVGTVTKHADGAWYLITGNKTLRFQLS